VGKDSVHEKGGANEETRIYCRTQAYHHHSSPVDQFHKVSGRIAQGDAESSQASDKLALHQNWCSFIDAGRDLSPLRM
jgi:hypothetical protein